MEMCYDGALVMPSNYAVMDADEMTYVEGGATVATLTKSECGRALGVLGLNASSVAIVGALAYTAAKMLIKKVAIYGDLATKVVGVILGWAASQVIALGVAVARGALNRGVKISWNWNPFKDAVGICASVRY